MAWSIATAKQSNIEKMFQLGRTRFIMKQGVLRLGVGLFIVNTVIDNISWSNQKLAFTKISFIGLLISLVFSLGAGYIYGIWVWPKIEQRHEEFALTPPA